MINNVILTKLREELPQIGLNPEEVTACVNSLKVISNFSHLDADTRNLHIATLSFMKEEVRMISGKLRANQIKKELVIKKLALAGLNKKQLKPTTELIAVESLDTESVAESLLQGVQVINGKVLMADKWHVYLNDVTWCLKDTARAFGARTNE